MKINLMLVYNFCSLGLIFVLKKNNFFFHFNRTAEPDQSILIFKPKSHIFHATYEYFLNGISHIMPSAKQVYGDSWV